MFALAMVMGDRVEPCRAPEPAGSAAAAAEPDAQDLYKSVYNGWKWWHVYCYRCHGTDANGTPLAPNLTDLNRKVPLKEFLKNGPGRIPRRRDAGLVETSRRQSDHAALLLRHGEDRQSAASGETRRSRTRKVVPGSRRQVGPRNSAKNSTSHEDDSASSWRAQPRGWSAHRLLPRKRRAASPAVAGARSRAQRAGEAIYRERCAGCHDLTNARIPRRDALKLMPASRILRALDFGVMMNVAYPMRRDEREAVATFLGSGASDPNAARAGVLRRSHDQAREPAESAVERLEPGGREHAVSAWRRRRPHGRPVAAARVEVGVRVRRRRLGVCATHRPRSVSVCRQRRRSRPCD